MDMHRTDASAEGAFDYLIVGAGLYGSVIARELTDRGFRVIVAERRNHIGGSAYTEIRDGICVHCCGPHIFHTDNEDVWRFITRFGDFREFINRPAAVYRGVHYSLPFSMKTFGEMWGVSDPEEAREIITDQSEAACKVKGKAGSLEYQAIRLVGTDIYERLIKGYSEKQWGRSCSELPSSFIRRLPVRFDFNDSYYDDKYQAVPLGGYTSVIENILEGIKVMTNTDYCEPETRAELNEIAGSVVFSGSIDEFFGYRYGRLEYRSLRFEHEKIEGKRYYQDRAVINFTEAGVPYTRVTEHKYFAAESETDPRDYTIITREYPVPHTEKNDPLYPLTDTKNISLYRKYRKLAESDSRVHFGGRLGRFRYYDMDDVIALALADAEKLAKKK